MDGLRALVGGGSQPPALFLCWGGSGGQPYVIPPPMPQAEGPPESFCHGSQLSPSPQPPSVAGKPGIMLLFCGEKLRLNEMPKIPSCSCQPEKGTDPTLRALIPKQPPGPAIPHLGCRRCCTDSTESCVSSGYRRSWLYPIQLHSSVLK